MTKFMLDKIKELWLPLIGSGLLIIGVFVGIISLLFYAIDTGDKNACRNYGNMSKQQVVFRTGRPNQCYVHTPKGWFTTKQIRSK